MRLVASVACAWVALTGMMLLVDYVGVRVVGLNGLVFVVHVGVSYFLAVAAFRWSLDASACKEEATLRWWTAFGVATAWWVFVFWLLAGWFHHVIGGWY